MWKWIKTYIASLRKDIVILLIVDCVFLIVMEFGLRRIPAPYPVFVKLGNLFVTLAISLLAAIVFYFVQIHLPATKQKLDLYPSIASLFKRIVNTQKEMVKHFAGVESYDNLTDEIIEKGIDSRDFYIKDAPLVIAGNLDRNANWMEYGFYELNDIEKSWDMIMRYSNYMDSECLSLLSKVQSNPTLGIFRALKGIIPNIQKQLTIQGFGKEFVGLWHFVQEQEAYYNKVLAPYENKE